MPDGTWLIFTTSLRSSELREVFDKGFRRPLLDPQIVIFRSDRSITRRAEWVVSTLTLESYHGSNDRPEPEAFVP